MSKSGKKFSISLRNGLAYTLIIIVFFAFIEGLSSATISVFQMMEVPTRSSPSRYDSELGWTGIPGAYYPNYYGQGKYVRTNSHGFRNEKEAAEQVSEGKLRIICSGDSFTYGQGVANDRTWCHRLTESSDQIETINLGQPGYGIDQVYLRFLRDGMTLDHSIHIFAFVSGDFDRMGRSQQHGYGKPMLELKSGNLEVTGVPVPRFSWWVSRGLERAEFRSINFAQRVLARLVPKEPNTLSMTNIKPVASRLFERVQQLGVDNGAITIFVFLPSDKDIGRGREWRLWVASAMDDLGLPFIDLTPALRRQPARDTFFIPEGEPGDGHYTEAGNAWVAKELQVRLMEMPRVMAVLAQAE